MENKPHLVTIDSCSKCNMNGIEKVVSSTDAVVNLISSCGNIEISGSELKISKFDSESGAFSLCGKITAIKYNKAKLPLWKRIFK